MASAADYSLPDYVGFNLFNNIKNNWAHAVAPTDPVVGVTHADTGESKVKVRDEDGTWHYLVYDTTGAAPVGSIVAWVGGYFADGSNASYARVLGTDNTVAAINTYANAYGWYVCNGAALSVVDALVYYGPGRYLPMLTDARFLMGGTTAGSIGGESANSHNHLIGITATTASAGVDLASDAGIGSIAVGAAIAHTHAVDFLAEVGSASVTENRPLYLACVYLIRVK